MFRLSSGSREHQQCAHSFFEAVKNLLSDTQQIATLLVTHITHELAKQLQGIDTERDTVISSIKSEIAKIICPSKIEYREDSRSFDIEVFYTMRVSEVVNHLNKTDLVQYTTPPTPPPTDLVGAHAPALSDHA